MLHLTRDVLSSCAPVRAERTVGHREHLTTVRGGTQWTWLIARHPQLAEEALASGRRDREKPKEDQHESGQDPSWSILVNYSLALLTRYTTCSSWENQERDQAQALQDIDQLLSGSHAEPVHRFFGQYSFSLMPSLTDLFHCALQENPEGRKALILKASPVPLRLPRRICRS